MLKSVMFRGCALIQGRVDLLKGDTVRHRYTIVKIMISYRI